MKPLFLFHISQLDQGFEMYDVYEFAIVAAPDEVTAKNMHPEGAEGDLGTWDVPENIQVRLLGKAAFEGEAHVICSSFRAGL